MWTPNAQEPSLATIKQLLSTSTSVLQRAGIDTPILDAEVMLSEAMGVTRSYLIAHPEARPQKYAVKRFREWVRLRECRMPLAHVVGHKEFYGADIEVSAAVLVPRPETEVLVEAAIVGLERSEPPMVAEIGVGSGAIAVAIAKALPHARIFGTESSARALDVAQRNVVKHSVAGRVELRLGDLFEPLEGLFFDAVISNPPYVPTVEIPKLQPEIAQEPREALDGGTDGLDCHRRIVKDAPAHLKPEGLLFLEVGQGQAAKVQLLLAEGAFEDIRSFKDHGGIERVVVGKTARRLPMPRE